MRLPALLLLALTALGAVYEWGGPARRGARALRAGRYDEALRALEAGRADMPDAAVIPYDEGLAHLGKGEPDSAAARFQEAMRLKGDAARAAAAYNLGNQAMRAKDYSRAAADARIEPAAAPEAVLGRARTAHPRRRGDPVVASQPGRKAGAPGESA